MNSTVLIGRLTRDVELRYTSETKKAVASFTIAVDRSYAGKDGQKLTDFFTVQVWGKLAENCANFISKGSLIGVKGAFQNRSYDTKEGEKRYITELIAENVQFLSFKKEDGGVIEAPNVSDLPEGYIGVSDDDIPFP